ncbi:hypothetical protein JTE90_011214 [Oedothorax gibbosus]|uniref:Uncharacterized protein n=1 Tax=Oedothorax gibbosus TaxID=931172 RepID=A0AAV6VXU0_9ARAC|nr:hypothetical protein JTE90_011214 [Oedothorax gibbosus]
MQKRDAKNTKGNPLSLITFKENTFHRLRIMTQESERVTSVPWDLANMFLRTCSKDLLWRFYHLLTVARFDKTEDFSQLLENKCAVLETV